MIGWRVDLGVINPPENPLQDKTNISQITFTDINRPFTIININSDFSYYGKDYYDIASKLESTIGDYYYMYSCFGRYSNDETYGTPRLQKIIPSADLAYPINKQNAMGGLDCRQIAIRFRSLNKLVIVDGGFTLHIIYDIGPDGSLSGGQKLYSSQKLLTPIIASDVSFLATYNYKGGNIYDNELRYIVGEGVGGTLGDYSIKTQPVPGEDTKNILKAIFRDAKPDFEGSIPPDNPYDPGGPSGPTQPTNPSDPGYLPPGTFDDTSDAIPDSPLPTLSAANTGFTRIYNPTLAQVQDLARYLWTDETVVQTIWNHIKQYFEDPMQAIIGFNLVPCAVPNAGSQSFALMYIDTGVTMNVAANQFVDVDCGTVKLERYYGSALDQSPYTRVSCFLPFIGTVRLNTDEVMGTTLRVKYRIDICSGSCVAKVLVDENVIYQYSGHCAINIPISSADFSSYVSSAISVARLAIGAGVAGAAGIGAATVSDPEQQTNRTVTINRTTTKTARNPATGRQITTGTRTTSETRTYPIKQNTPQDTTQASFNALSPENISNTAGQIMASKPSIEHSGSFSGNTGYLGVRRPYLLIERPNMCMPEQYQHFNGFPAMITMELSSCKGFTRVHQVQLTGMSATNPEQAEILSLLKSGVYFSV